MFYWQTRYFLTSATPQRSCDKENHGTDLIVVAIQEKLSPHTVQLPRGKAQSANVWFQFQSDGRKARGVHFSVKTISFESGGSGRWWRGCLRFISFGGGGGGGGGRLRRKLCVNRNPGNELHSGPLPRDGAAAPPPDRYIKGATSPPPR